MLKDDTSSIAAKKALARRTRKTIQNIQQEEDSASIPMKKAPAKRIWKTIQDVQQKKDLALTSAKKALESIKIQKTIQDV